MAIYTMEGVYSMHGLGDLTPAQRALMTTSIPGTQAATTAVPGMPQTADGGLAPILPPAPSFLDQWGVPIAAGVGAFVAGLAIAKFATGRKRKR